MPKPPFSPGDKVRAKGNMNADSAHGVKITQGTLLKVLPRIERVGKIWYMDVVTLDGKYAYVLLASRKFELVTA